MQVRNINLSIIGECIMRQYGDAPQSTGNMSLLDRLIRVGLGFSVLLLALHYSVHGTEAYPITKLFATIVVLTGIIGWDPVYALFQRIVSRLSYIEAMTFSTGNISMQDRALRIGLGLSVLVISLQGPFGGMEAYPFIKIFATLVVLTGIAGWDPFYSAFRSFASRVWRMRLEKPMAYLPSS